jgi:hypothetical protein
VAFQRQITKAITLTLQASQLALGLCSRIREGHTWQPQTPRHTHVALVRKLMFFESRTVRRESSSVTCALSGGEERQTFTYNKQDTLNAQVQRQ